MKILEVLLNYVRFQYVPLISVNPNMFSSYLHACLRWIALDCVESGKNGIRFSRMGNKRMHLTIRSAIHGCCGIVGCINAC